MELKNFYEMQKKLDDYIQSRKLSKPSEKELLTDTLLALQVEVSELANATRCFKHWSKKGPMDRDTILDEYADIMHFFLSVGNQLEFTPEEVEQAYIQKNKINYQRQKEGY
jgi:dimeric dUTPase (all-alpha-NTP-PPase superfamily)